MIHTPMICDKCGGEIEWDCRCHVAILENGKTTYHKLCKKCKKEMIGR